MTDNFYRSRIGEKFYAGGGRNFRHKESKFRPTITMVKFIKPLANKFGGIYNTVFSQQDIILM
jgi:hypothetical protein